jgi:hypothetical protein
LGFSGMHGIPLLSMPVSVHTRRKRCSASSDEGGSGASASGWSCLPGPVDFTSAAMALGMSSLAGVARRGMAALSAHRRGDTATAAASASRNACPCARGAGRGCMRVRRRVARQRTRHDAMLDDDDRTTVARRGRRQQGGELLEKGGAARRQVAHTDDMVGGARQGQESKNAMLKA